MDQQTRNVFEQLCELAEIEQDPEKFSAIKRDIVHLLEQEEASLDRYPPAKSRFRPAPENVA